MQKGQITKSMILDKAIVLASRVGMEGLTIGKLANAVGMSKSGLFAHFASKEKLQVAVLQEAAERFIDAVINPALKSPRGEARIRALFDNWLEWEKAKFLPGGCPFISAAMELADQPGPARDFLVSSQNDWFNFLSGAAKIAVDEGYFREDLDTMQFAHDFFSIILGFQHAKHLMHDESADMRARRSFESLLNACRRRVYLPNTDEPVPSQ